MHEDGSGTELLSSQTVEELLDKAYSDPTVALLKELLPDTQGALFSVLKTMKHNNHKIEFCYSLWLFQMMALPS